MVNLIMKRTLNFLLLASLLISSINISCATPVENQAKLLYTALKGNKSTESVYAYCTKHKISIEQIANETKKICETNNDWETYGKVTEQEVIWEDRMQSMSFGAKIAIAIGATAAIIATYMLYSYFKKPAIQPEPQPAPVDPNPQPAPRPIPHPVPNNNNNRPRPPRPGFIGEVPAAARNNQPNAGQNPQAPQNRINQVFGNLIANPELNRVLENPRVQQLANNILHDPEAINAFEGPQGDQLENIANAFGNGQFDVNQLDQIDPVLQNNAMQILNRAIEQEQAQAQQQPMVQAGQPAGRAQWLFNELQEYNPNFRAALQNPQARANIERFLLHPNVEQHLNGMFGDMIQRRILVQVNDPLFAEQMANNDHVNQLMQQYGLH